MSRYRDRTADNRKLPTDVKEKWLTALRSGSFQQGKSALRMMLDGEQIGYCCLGVLSDIFIVDKLALDPTCDVGWKRREYNGTFGLHTHPHNNDGGGLPTVEVNDWANRGADGWLVYVDKTDAKKYFEGDSPEYMPNSVTLYDLNDRGIPFTEIADIIEKYL